MKELELLKGLATEKKKSGGVTVKLLKEKLEEERSCTPTPIPIFNLMTSGDLNGGYYSGLTVFAAESKSFKTSFLLMMMEAYLKKWPESIAIFYDSENGASAKMLQAYDIDPERVLIIDIANIEELKFNLMDLLEEKMKDMGDNPKVFIGIDSIGNLASKKEVDDAMKESSAADMTRAKQLKSLFRMVTPYLGRYDIPMVAVNHVYQEIGCLAEDTEIVMADLSVKMLKDVEVGDVVYTRFGDKKVLTKHNPEELEKYSHEMYRITLKNGAVIECTENHRFLVSGEWKRADELNMSDLLML